MIPDEESDNISDAIYYKCLTYFILSVRTLSYESLIGPQIEGQSIGR